jgi:hypothetical protein
LWITVLNVKSTRIFQVPSEFVAFACFFPINK